jgi:hypothetical protein
VVGVAAGAGAEAAGLTGGAESSVATGTTFGSLGASGAMILAWQEGHSIFRPHTEVSTLKFCRQLGQLNLNSVIMGAILTRLQKITNLWLLKTGGSFADAF